MMCRQIKFKVAMLAKVLCFDSQNSNRDSHMLEVTEALKYPNVTFSSTSITQNGNQLAVKGTLNFHEVAREVSFMANVQTVNHHKIVTGGFTTLLEDYKINQPSLMLLPVDNKMKIEFPTILR